MTMMSARDVRSWWYDNVLYSIDQNDLQSQHNQPQNSHLVSMEMRRNRLHIGAP